MGIALFPGLRLRVDLQGRRPCNPVCLALSPPMKRRGMDLEGFSRALYFSRTVCYGITVQVSANYFYIV